MKRKLYLSDKTPAIMFLTNRQIVYFVENFHSKTHKFTVKSNSRNTDWIVDPFAQVKSAEYGAKINNKIVCLRSGAFPIFS